MFILYCILKFIIEQLILVFKRKAILISAFKNGDYKKKNEPIGHKTIEELPAPTKQLLIPDVYLTEKVQKIIKTAKLMKMNRFLQTNKKVPVLLYQKFFLKREI